MSRLELKYIPAASKKKKSNKNDIYFFPSTQYSHEVQVFKEATFMSCELRLWIAHLNFMR